MDWKDFMGGMKRNIRSFNVAVPETSAGFSTLTKAAKSSQHVDVKTLEFVALGISVAERCEPCIGFHIEALIKCGATREEVADVLGMALQMGGGPSLMYASKALDCWDQMTA
ncbi:carboxymuconolactone decarboxylase family protein [Falsihalocynthiibacter arcticus]|uniref:Alkylhydroperoxidase n=1 Tax=Falsihalocynthiibacter arcticus TaxID=1579316 RepID=A0A126UXE1_9RHOB|nr:carboxymuconolactone decarboxylase family protein [Falsihalocynthiibacter arcticus]AML50109.1 alkylhydroperoxidase [Falsihalocynthiibacter arcticus]